MMEAPTRIEASKQLILHDAIAQRALDRPGGVRVVDKDVAVEDISVDDEGPA